MNRSTPTPSKRNLWLASGAAFSALMLVAGVSVARGPGFLGKDDSRATRFVSWVVDDTLDELDATEEQRREIVAIKDRLVKRGLALKAERQTVKGDIRAILESDKPDSDQLHAIVDRESKKFTDLGHELADAALEIHSVLDAEQRAQLAEKIAEHQERRSRHW